MLLPHQLFAALATYPKNFTAALNNFGLADFWGKAVSLEDPQLRGHPMLEVEGWVDKAVPMVLYGDGARFARKDSLELICISPLLSRGSVWANKWVLAAFVKSCETQETWKQIMEVLAWSLTALAKGVHPMTDHNNQPWDTSTPEGKYGARFAGKDLTSGKHFGIIHRLAGDLDWYQKRLKFRLGPSSNLPCCWCDGGRPPHPPFLDLRPHAGWMGTLKTYPQPWPNDHPLKDAPGLSLFTLSPELRHS